MKLLTAIPLTMMACAIGAAAPVQATNEVKEFVYKKVVYLFNNNFFRHLNLAFFYNQRRVRTTKPKRIGQKYVNFFFYRFDYDV